MKKEPEYKLTPKEEKQLSELIEKQQVVIKQIEKLEKERSRYTRKIIVLLEKTKPRA